MGKIDPESIKASTLNYNDIVMGHDPSNQWARNADDDFTIVLPNGVIADRILSVAQLVDNDESHGGQGVACEYLSDDRVKITIQSSILRSMQNSIQCRGGGYPGEFSR